MDSTTSAKDHQPAPAVNGTLTSGEAKFLPPCDHLEKPIWGAAAIAREINRTPRQTYHLLTTGGIQSAVKKGKSWAALPSQLRREFGGL